MSDAPWFFHAPLPADGGALWVNRDEARHVLGARRLRPGDAVAFMDGAGGVARGTIANERDRDGAQRVDVAPPERLARAGRLVTVATAIPKGDRSATLMESMGPLGVACVVPLACEWSVTTLSDNLRTRLERIVLEGCKQSRQPWVPSLAQEQAPVDAARSLAGGGTRLILLDAEGESLINLLGRLDTARGGTTPIALFIGPEGGFSPREREQLLEAGAIRASLGTGILRVELAAIVAAATTRGA
ncbi:MAG: 16S rRNA (uracil(1498)-N(3))-methyltransferase [Planctomycetota bacterium]|nr:16S rRNA (uracil(1498)-N(3))-methyltransferase [Planctomycetota bacterium]MDA1105300.1 16S rRNA (uracil(1498)-N(3))-methyltransferase [Planctomycetota bacterium]